MNGQTHAFPDLFRPAQTGLMALFALLLFATSVAQPVNRSQPLYRNFTNINSGLPSNTVYKVITDGYGYLWMTTERGLVRYDGNTFRKYTAPQTDNEFIQVYQPGRDQLWLFGYSGNSRLFSLQTHTFQNALQEPDEPRFKSPVILAWQKNDTLSLYRINTTFSQTVLSGRKREWAVGKKGYLQALLNQWKIPDHTNGISADSLSALFNHKPYAIQIIGDALILGNKIFRQKGNEPARLIFDGDRHHLSGNISSFAKVGNDLYLGFIETQELLLIRNYFAAGKTPKQNYTTLLTRVPVTSLTCDYQGNLWVGTLGKGVYLFTPADLATRHLAQIGSQPSDSYLSGISLPDQRITVLGHQRDRVSIISGEKTTDFQLSSRQSINEIRAVYKAADQWFFFGNQNSYMAQGIKMPGNIAPLNISSHTPYKDGAVFRGQFYFTTKSACFIIDREGHITKDVRYSGINTLSIAPFNEKICFYGTSDGIYRNNTKQRLFASIRINKLRVIGKNLVVCTQEGAFVLPLDEEGRPGKGKKIFGQNSYDVKADGQHGYITTDSGLAVFNLKGWKQVNEMDTRKYSFSVNDFLLEKDTLILATNAGICYIPKRFAEEEKNSVPPRIYLASSLTGFDPSRRVSEISYSGKLAITLMADVLDYTRENKNIRYQISENGDAVSNWQVLNGRTITLNRPEPGRYVITVATAGATFGPQNSTSHTIIICPLWYQQLWAKVLSGFIIVLVISLLIFKWYQIQLQKAAGKMNAQLRMNELENKNLFAQLKPHFIFNVLTPLQSYFINGDAIGGLNYLDNYAKLMRGFLQESRESYITIEKETDFLNHYLFVQQQRFSNGFTYAFKLDSGLSASKLYVPTLILQPIVENAVEHGVKNESGRQGSIQILIRSEPHKILVTITDNGEGPAHDVLFFKPGHALQIIKERLELIHIKYGTGILHVASNEQAPGTTVTIELPLLTTQP